MARSKTIMHTQEMQQALASLAEQLLERHGSCTGLALIGIQRRGASLALRLKHILEARLGVAVPTGSLDITLYRDDWTSAGAKPAVGKTHIPFELEGTTLVLVDDVLFTGRTIRAALEALSDFGRPSKVELMVLVDRGHRELPIHPDYAGYILPTSRADRVDVLVAEYDSKDEVLLVRAM